MHGRAQALCQPGKADRRLVPFAVTDALDIIQNVALIEHRNWLTEGERFHFLRCAGFQLLWCACFLRGGFAGFLLTH
ncbi:hypothetical protein [Salmonella phage vB_Sal_PHB48]|nr:hypothetical protein [Salmonella phage vB_Sal_PHB48]